MPIENLELWNKLKHVPTEHTKAYKRTGGFSGTNIAPQWRLEVMTETFGPVGQGWGYKVVERWKECWGPKSPEFPEGTCQCAYVMVNVWYRLSKDSEPIWTGEQVGGTIVDRTPDEVWKMSITDAIGKCLAAIGVASNVYLNEEYDDPSDKYSHYRDRGPDPRNTAASDRGIPPKQPIPNQGQQTQQSPPPPRTESAPQSQSTPSSQPPVSPPGNNPAPSGAKLCPKGHSRTKLQAGGKELICFECKTTYPLTAEGVPAEPAPTSHDPAPRQNSEPRF